MKKDSKIYIAGHNGMVGSAIIRKLKAEGYEKLAVRSSKELDLRDQASVRDFFQKERPDYVFLAAAKVGGIHANNTYRADFLYDNLVMEANVIQSAHEITISPSAHASASQPNQRPLRRKSVGCGFSK